MKPAALIPHALVERKPPHGKPCTHCGVCCIATVCPLGRAILGQEHGPCPALLYDDNHNSRCGLVADPMKYARRVALEHGVAAASASALVLIASATGCDARINGEPADPEFYATMIRWDRDHRREVMNARKLWGMPT